jgi:hypothetical protein
VTDLDSLLEKFTGREIPTKKLLTGKYPIVGFTEKLFCLTSAVEYLYFTDDAETVPPTKNPPFVGCAKATPDAKINTIREVILKGFMNKKFSVRQ